MLFALILVLNPGDLLSISLLESPHGDRSKLPKGCASCHRGHGMFNTSLLPDASERFCFRCHGSIVTVQATRRQGDLSEDTNSDNIEYLFDKPFHHPIEKTGIHSHNETLPETDPSARRHVACVDCHHYHFVSSMNSTAGIRGVTSRGALVDTINSEYELCFKCHSYSANLPVDQTNKAELMSTSNPSYHPVIGPGKNRDVPSLLLPYTSSSTITCTDCHNNNDATGPRGPHGSTYRYILKKNFDSSDGPEGDYQYALCYSCHRRTSILGNESFPLHNHHISTVGTSCRTCHSPHGSTINTHLISFDSLSITASSGGRMDYIDTGARSGECYLTCHDRDHNPEIYPSRATPPSTFEPSRWISDF